MDENTNSTKLNFRLWPLLFFILLCLGIFLWLLGYAPFYAPSYLFWAGVLVCLTGIISFIKPLRFLFILNRRIAIIVFFCGLALSVLNMYWQVPSFHVNNKQQHLDNILPDYSFYEYHETLVNCSPKEVMAMVQEVSVTDLPVIQGLLRLREIAAGEIPDKKPYSKHKGLEEMREGGFLDLVVDSNEFVMGMIGQPHSSEVYPHRLTSSQFIAFKDSNFVKIAFNFVAKDLGNGQTLLSTETRIQTFDHKTSRVFSRYWTIIYPGSAIIRRVWLNAIAKRAETKVKT